MVVDWVEEGEVELGYSLGDYMALEGQAVGEALAGEEAYLRLLLEPEIQMQQQQQPEQWRWQEEQWRVADTSGTTDSNSGGVEREVGLVGWCEGGVRRR